LQESLGFFFPAISEQAQMTSKKKPCINARLFDLSGLSAAWQDDKISCADLGGGG